MRWLSVLVVSVLVVVAAPWVGAAEVGSLIASLWFERRGGTEYLDTSDVTRLVGTAYGVALGIAALDGPWAGELVEATRASRGKTR